jgi:sigma-B regulation protein RsbU (phosphoserine phosphatase)
MYVPIELTGEQVVLAFRHDAPSLFFGAVVMAAGLVAAGYSAIRRSQNRLLIYFALFAMLYGFRMWVQSNLLGITMQGSAWYSRASSALDFIVGIPGFLFLDAAGFLKNWMRAGIYILGALLASLGVATLVVGPQAVIYQINAVLIIVALVTLGAHSITRRSVDPDFLIVLRGLLIFAGFVVWENIRNLLGIRLPDTEPIGFVVFLAALGYVAARQTVRRELQLNEIQNELEVAKRIQLSILPGKFPDSANFRVAARYVPMTSVAGDFYDYIIADGKCTGLLIADVSGHGVPAALIASMVKMAATAQREHAADPSSLLAGMNAALFGNTQNQFVTAAYVHLDSESRELRYAAAGHPPMLLLRGGEVQEVLQNGLILAAFDSPAYANATQRLKSGDRLLLYTDGIVEAASRAGEFFGQEALSALLRQTSGIAPAEAADRIISAVQKWAISQDDDLTVLVCDYMPS